jgi:outer membrane receptor protein involved in Fe transport
VDQNPYVANDLVIRHEERPVFLTGGTEVKFEGEMQARLALEYMRVRSYPLYLDGAGEGIWRPEYGGLTRIVALRFDLQAELESGHALSSSLVLQGARNTFTGMTPTYFPAVTIGGTYRYRFPFGLTAGAEVKVVARQTTDAAAARTIPAFTLVDLTATYTIVRDLTVNGTLQNLLNPSYSWWEGYRAQPRGVAVSLSHSW